MRVALQRSMNDVFLVALGNKEAEERGYAE